MKTTTEEGMKKRPSSADTDAFGIALAQSEAVSLVRLGKIIKAPCGKSSANETAKVTASIKVIELLMDLNTPAALRNKLEKLRGPALASLRDVVENGKVSTAAGSAGAFILRTSAKAAPGAWPPDVTSPSWIERMEKAEKLCQNT